ncbi:MAG: AAA family ATPase, partial [Spirochaetes bacterium]|nr:AAA family ATPase [Spirochaetota bacterium]
MRTLIPQFILQTKQEADQHGTLEGPTLFLDISGFTQLTSALMQHGDDGAEVLSGIINTLFDPLITEIEEAGGFVATFAGDALTAVFPDKEIDRVAHAARRMQRVFDEKHLQRTPAGEFAVEAKIGLGYGAIEWGTIHSSGSSTYYFRGAAVDEAAQAEQRCNRGEVLLGPSGVDVAGDRLPLQPSSDGFGKVTRSASQAENAQDNLAKLSAETHAGSGLDAASLHELQERYVPVGSLPTQTEGEFRSIASVFVSVSVPTTHEETAGLVRPVLDLAGQYGGYFNLLDFGDKGGVMLVLFGAPTAQGDDLHRAADFSLALSGALGERGRVGFASGTVFAGYVGNRDRSTYTALGAVVNLSARLAMDAEWGTTVTAGDAAQRLQARNSLTEVYRRRFKGFEGEIPVYTVSGANDVARQEPPFVGRDSQIERLRGVVGRMIDGTERAHYVLGEAGVGKSRLVHRAVEGGDFPATTVFLDTDTILRKSMNSLPRLVRAAFELAEIDVDRMEGVTAMGKLVEWLEQHEVSKDTTEELRRTSSGLLSLLGPVASDSLYAQLDPQARFELTASAFQALVSGLSVVSPLLIVVDNAHALDADTRNIFSRLVSGGAESRFGVFFVGRGGPSDSPFGIEAAVGSERLSSVKGLSADEIREVTSNIIEGPVDQSLVDFILHRVGTNPLYVTELARYLVDHRLLTRGESGYRVSTEEVSLPTEVNALLVARVDSLPTHLKEAAQAAAVLGAEFDPVVLEKLVNAGPEFQKTLDSGTEAGLWR